jgi:ABC-2 type transport system permease protein
MSRPTRLGNVATVARREYVVRARSRSFLIGTALLLVGVIAIAFAPALIERLGRTNPTQVAITSTDSGLAASAAAALEPILTGAAGPDGTGVPGTGLAIVVGGPLDTERARVTDGELDGVLDIGRSAGGELSFTYYTDDSATGRTATLVRQGANAFAIADRLDRLGIAPADRAALFAPAAVQVASPDPDQAGPTKDDTALAGQSVLGFGMTVLIFMMVVIYGNWIAQSVVEEKSSRVMEVVLNAATPFELLTGKVLGVGAVALTQYAALLVGGVLALALQGPVTGLILQGTGGGAMDVPLGITPGLLVALAAYGVLGFLLYATLFAAAGSLVSRSEDVSSAVTPLTMLCTLGYIIAVYGSTGLLDFSEAWMVGLTLVPFLSPFMMLSRVAAGAVEAWQLAASIGILAVSVVVALWLAARIYAVGVLLYGSWPGWKGALRLLRQGL